MWSLQNVIVYRVVHYIILDNTETSYARTTLYTYWTIKVLLPTLYGIKLVLKHKA